MNFEPCSFYLGDCNEDWNGNWTANNRVRQKKTLTSCNILLPFKMAAEILCVILHVCLSRSRMVFI